MPRSDPGGSLFSRNYGRRRHSVYFSCYLFALGVRDLAHMGEIGCHRHLHRYGTGLQILRPCPDPNCSYDCGITLLQRWSSSSLATERDPKAIWKQISTISSGTFPHSVCRFLDNSTGLLFSRICNVVFWLPATSEYNGRRPIRLLSRKVLPRGLVELLLHSFSDQDTDLCDRVNHRLSRSPQSWKYLAVARSCFSSCSCCRFFCCYDPIEDGDRRSPHSPGVSVSICSCLAASNS